MLPISRDLVIMFPDEYSGLPAVIISFLSAVLPRNDRSFSVPASGDKTG